jgi:hypothetical protein
LQYKEGPLASSQAELMGHAWEHVFAGRYPHKQGVFKPEALHTVVQKIKDVLKSNDDVEICALVLVYLLKSKPLDQQEIYVENIAEATQVP